ncbi:MAG TPA: hypothetical protein VI488_10790 [Candidatus Angelobacter sp.]
MVKKVLFALFVFSTAVSAMPLVQDQDDARWIDEVKNASVDQIETGLPHESVARWFADLARPDEIDYEVKECANTADERLLCVIAYTKPPHPQWGRRIQLRFVVAAATPPKTISDRAEMKPVALRLLWASEGPSNPMMKRPDHRFSRLSELEKMVRGSTTH